MDSDFSQFVSDLWRYKPVIIVLLVAWFIVLLAFFSQNVYVGLLGVAMMFASAIVIERNARLLGRAGWRDITQPHSGDDAAGTLGPRARTLRDWLSRQRHRSE